MDQPTNLRYSGYYRSRSWKIDETLTRVGHGTPCGEYMRRFWHPVARSESLGDLPLALRHLGEDLVLFRDRAGRLGLVHRHCPHRNVSLEFGIITERGIRCCYHGWEFDIDGTLLCAPAEADDSHIRQHVCVGAYPLKEYKGLIFAYLGPPEEMPEFPIYDTMDIEGGELIPYEVTLPCNWVQVAENSVDPMHVVFLHTRVNIVQFTEKLGVLPVMEWRKRPFGLFYTKARRINEYIWISTNDVIFPNFTQAGAVYESTEGKEPKYFGRNSFTRWIVPVDDENTVVLAYRHFNRHAESSRPEWRTPEALEKIDISELRNRPYTERQSNPGDYEVFVGQGRITPHSSEHLATSDRGVVHYRKRLKDEIRKLQQGKRPVQPTSVATRPIPTYGSDTVIHFPSGDDGRDDDDAVSVLQKAVGDLYLEADAYVGEARYAFLAKRLAQLNR
jgi:phenylpropionate dioxygenase-like ring-hydroxylating dioxygenase large terminal subunit